MNGRQARASRQRSRDERLAAVPPGIAAPAVFLVVRSELYGVALSLAGLPLRELSDDVARALTVGPMLDAERHAAARPDLEVLRRLTAAALPLQALAEALASAELLLAYDVRLERAKAAEECSIMEDTAQLLEELHPEAAAHLRSLAAAVDLDQVERLVRLAATGHTDHCAKRQVWGDGACECGVSPPTE